MAKSILIPLLEVPLPEREDGRKRKQRGSAAPMKKKKKKKKKKKRDWLKRRSPRRVGRENNSTGYINAFHPPFSNVPLPDVVLLNRRRMWSRLSRSQSVSFI
ncbi:hypothetical protein K0M31_011649 [Melipona bicolor]|uniref:Uncharacterized protein n=1 Tax=Melipona bicolor TaxID=60889 RepID=A0AA40G9Y2_9HYME|nr:hypothetical protein K0M31_011649 [Melipona bicolor]